MSCKLFISHAAADVDKVTPIVDCITACFEISNEEIMYTSSLTKGIRNGKDFNKELREAIQESELVIVFLSANYIKSQYCLIELGATWGTNKKHFIIKENRDISFHELSIFSTTTQDILRDETIGKLHRVLNDELNLKQKLTDFLAILEQCKKASNKISRTIPQDAKNSSDFSKQDSTEKLIETDGIKIFKDHYTTYSEKLKQIKTNIQYCRNIHTGHMIGNNAFEIIEEQYKQIKHFLKQYASHKEDVQHLSHQNLGKFGNFYTALKSLIANIDYLGAWYQIHQDFHKDYEFCVSEYGITKDETDKYRIEESNSERLAAILFIMRYKCNKVSKFDKDGCDIFLSNGENKIIAAVLAERTSNNVKEVLESLLLQGK